MLIFNLNRRYINNMLLTIVHVIIISLQDCVYCIKESFNKEFEEVLRLKRVEIARIQEKNVRISKIISQLKLDETIVQPLLSTSEVPERLLVVEVSIEMR